MVHFGNLSYYANYAAHTRWHVYSCIEFVFNIDLNAEYKQ